MQMSKCFLAACAVAALLPATSRADTEAQIKARQALEQKMNELKPPAPAAVPQAPAAAQSAPQTAPPPPATKAAEPAAAQQFQSAPQIQKADPESITKARDAMRQKMQELQPQLEAPAPAAAATAAPASAPVPPAAPATAPASAPVVVAAPVVRPQSAPAEGPFGDLPAGAAASPDAIAKAREALHEKMQQVEPQPVPPVTAAPPKPAGQAMKPAEPTPPPAVRPVSEPPPVAVRPPPPPKGSSTFQPLTGPELPYSAEKSQRLANLLQKYKADQITPEEYHAERAKILAGP